MKLLNAGFFITLLGEGISCWTSKFLNDKVNRIDILLYFIYYESQQWYHWH